MACSAYLAGFALALSLIFAADLKIVAQVCVGTSFNFCGEFKGGRSYKVFSCFGCYQLKIFA